MPPILTASNVVVFSTRFPFGSPAFAVLAGGELVAEMARGGGDLHIPGLQRPGVAQGAPVSFRVRAALYEAADVILTHSVRGSDLKTWALAVARRAGMRKAKVALARKLAVVLHRMLRDQTDFIPHKGAPMAASTQETTHSSGRLSTIASPERSPFAKTTDPVRPQCPQQHPG